MNRIMSASLKGFSQSTQLALNCLLSRVLPISAVAVRMSSTRITPRRAILYVPGHDLRKIQKVKSLDVDCAVLDCEDGVAYSKKNEAREVICQTLQNLDLGRSEYAARINSVDSGLAEKDLAAILTAQRLPDTVMVPKVETVWHIKWIGEKISHYLKGSDLSRKLNLVIFVESAVGLLDLREICKTAIEMSSSCPFTLDGVVFGSDDFCADIGASRSTEAMEVLLARQQIIVIAKSFRIQAIDMVHINYKDVAGLKKQAEEGATMGFTGKQIIHPSQVSVVQNAFSPAPEKVEWATELIKLYDEHQRHGKGAFTFRGAMIDRPLLLQARYVVEIAEVLKKDNKGV